jgi:hypothetical protein
MFMSKSVFGILENDAEAREVVRELIDAGFRDADVQVVSGAHFLNLEKNSAPASTTVSEQPRTTFAETTGTFFQSLVGRTDQSEERPSGVRSYTDDQSYYFDALERGRIVLIIRAADQQSADCACKVLNRHGGDNISADTRPNEPRGATTIPVSTPDGIAGVPANRGLESPGQHMTPSEKTEGRIRDRGVRVYDYANAAEAPANLAEPQPDATPAPWTRAAKP